MRARMAIIVRYHPVGARKRPVRRHVNKEFIVTGCLADIVANALDQKAAPAYGRLSSGRLSLRPSQSRRSQATPTQPIPVCTVIAGLNSTMGA